MYLFRQQCRPGETGLGFADMAAELAAVLSMAQYDATDFPYQSGALFNCALNEVCSDDAVCIPLSASPLFGKPCPEQSATSGYCGPGLFCIMHMCAVCAEGAVNSARTRACVRGQWTSDAFQLFLLDPLSWSLFFIASLLAAQIGVSAWSTLYFWR